MKLYALLFAFVVGSQVLTAAEKPNIIILFADDISARELPIYGSPVWTDPHSQDSTDPQFRARTPVLDRLAKEGCWIKTAWATTVCMPSRAMMMTGRYAHLHKWWFNGDQGRTTLPNGKLATWPLYESSPLQLGVVAQQGGYGTFWSGKTQMSGDLQKFGFDEGCFTPGEHSDTGPSLTNLTMHEKKTEKGKLLFNSDTDKQISSYMQTSWYWCPQVTLMNRPGITEAFSRWPNTPESIARFDLNTYGPDVELEFIFDFMKRQKEKNKPFFIYHTSHLGHDAFDWYFPEAGNKWPGTPIVKWDGEKYTRTEPNITGAKGVYDAHGSITGPGIHNHINYLDYQVWLYQNKLREMGIENDTIFIFCADNGTSGYGKTSPDRQKGAHVPLIIHAPGMKKHGEQDVLANLCDILPTVADIGGVKIPADYEINGVSLVPFLFTDKPTHRDWIYAYRGAGQFVRGVKVMKDANEKWWDVSSETPDDNSFPQITDWNAVSEVHRAEREKLEAIIKPFDTHDTEHDAPGTVAPPLENAKAKRVGKKAGSQKNSKQGAGKAEGAEE